jgi:hypothetical protein
MKTTIDINGLRIEHNGSDQVLLIAEAPSKVRIKDLIAELNSLPLQTAEVEQSRHSDRGSLCTQHEGSNRIAGLE